MKRKIEKGKLTSGTEWPSFSVMDGMRDMAALNATAAAPVERRTVWQEIAGEMMQLVLLGRIDDVRVEGRGKRRCPYATSWTSGQSTGVAGHVGAAPPTCATDLQYSSTVRGTEVQKVKLG